MIIFFLGRQSGSPIPPEYKTESTREAASPGPSLSPCPSPSPSPAPSPFHLPHPSVLAATASLVRSSSLEDLTSPAADFDLLPGEIIRASSVSGRGMLLNNKKVSGMDKIGSFRKHFRKAISSVGAEKDKILQNLQRTQSGGTLT